MDAEPPPPPFQRLLAPDGPPEPAGDLGGGVVAIGSFDGVHRGHQAVLGETLARARAGRPALALTFEPHPRVVLRGDAVFALTPPAAKARVMAALGLDALIVVPFDRAFAAWPAERFTQDILARRLAAAEVVVGWDFQFGANRRGNAKLLTAEGDRLGFGVGVIAPLVAAAGGAHSEAAFADPVSSTRIRAALAAGDIAEANALLGYRWFVEAPVVRGDARGRTLGYPTANMALRETTTLAHGIYAVLFDAGGVRFKGVASFGRRPTFGGGAPLLETHVFDFEGDLYGAEARVTFVAHLRPERAFASAQALVAEMDRDATAARAILAGLAPLTPLDAALGPA
jgi:riboflavin kinase/FMN adenylyltransferase